MINMVTLVGRITKDAEVKELENGKSVCNITLAVPRSYKNAQGEYDTDYIDFALWGDVAKNAGKYYKKGDMIGVKGRLLIDYRDINGMKMKELKLVAERITPLSRNNKNKNIDDVER